MAIPLIVLLAIVFWVGVCVFLGLVLVKLILAFGIVIPLGLILAGIWWWLLDSAEDVRRNGP